MIAVAGLLAAALMAGQVLPAPAPRPADLERLLPHLTAAERAELDRLLPIWCPNPPRRPSGINPQAMALASEADELYYGGQAGGGKSDLLLGAALTQHRKGVIFRREFSQLTDLVERAQTIAGRWGRYNGQSHVLKLRRPGEPLRSLEFGGVQWEDDKQRYRGRPHDLKAFDELPEFTLSQYRFLIAWTRTTVQGQRCRVIGAGNPPSHAEGLWVIEYWGPWLNEKHPSYPARPGELRWFATIDGDDVEVDGPGEIRHRGERILPKSRTFIPASLADNPILEATDYRRTLQNLPEPLRSQLLFGDFQIGLQDDAFQLIPTEWIRAAIERGKGQDPPDIRQTHVGVDVARGGRDRTVIAPRRRWWIDQLEVHPGVTTQDGPAVAALVLPHLARGGLVTIDAEGVGTSPFDSLRMAVPGAAIVPVVFGDGAPKKLNGEPATDRSGLLTFANLRAYCYWMVREALDPDPVKNPEPLALPDDRELFAELAAPRYSTRNGRLLVEEKARIKERIGRSPDKADAIAVTFAVDAPVTLAEGSIRTGESVFGDSESFDWGSDA